MRFSNGRTVVANATSDQNGQIEVANSEGPLAAHVAGRTIIGEGAFQVTLQGGRVTAKVCGEGATVEVK